MPSIFSNSQPRCSNHVPWTPRLLPGGPRSLRAGICRSSWTRSEKLPHKGCTSTPWRSRRRNHSRPFSIRHMTHLEQLLQRLIRHEVEFVLVGGYAAMLYGVSLVTRDVDVCAPFNFENLGKIHASLAGIHPYHRETPQQIPFVMPGDFQRKLRNLYLATDDGPIDFLGEVLGVGDYEKVFAASVVANTSAGSFRVLNIDTLIISKEAAGRDRDKAAVIQLRGIRNSAHPESGKGQ